MPTNRLSIRVNEIGEYIRHHSCERRFKLEMNSRRIARQLPFAERLFNTIDPVLQASGREREAAWERSLQEGGLIDITDYNNRPEGHKETPWVDFANQVASLQEGQMAYGREVAISARLGVFDLEGRVDFILVLWDGGRPRLRLVECKASRRDRTYHRVQVAIYRLLLCEVIREHPLIIDGLNVDINDIECVVARIDETTSQIQDVLRLERLDIDMEESDVIRLLSCDGALIRIARSDIDHLYFQLDQKCDGCVFNIHCFSECGRTRRLELLSIQPSTVRALHRAGISNIDDLADLDLTSDVARQARGDSGLSCSLDHLRLQARSRRKTLPGGEEDPDSYEVGTLPNTGNGQLPEYNIGGRQLVRVYLSVDYDYSENRIGALSAHVTNSEGEIHTEFEETERGWRPNPNICERRLTSYDQDGHALYELSPVQGRSIVEVVNSVWTGRYEVDSGVEMHLIQSFFHRLVDAIADVAATAEAPIHFYVWSRSEMAHLVEACSRVSSRLLTHLRELLGCRESLEQLLYSCLQEEVDRRFALGWTGRGLAVATSLRWFSRRYHWFREVNGVGVYLDHELTQDIFDFKTELGLKADGSWATRASEAVLSHKFEIRSRFYDSLTAPYWRAYWRILSSPDDQNLSHAVRNAIRRYNNVRVPNVLRTYLEARAHALRWIEERIRFKNREITKPMMSIVELPSFELGVENTAHASIDFLRLDQHVKATDWIASHLTPPANRVLGGKTIPLSDVISGSNNRLSATINLEGFDIDLETLRTRCSFAEASFVRLSPCSADPHHGQTFGHLIRNGKTCKIDSIDWETGQIELTVLPYFQDNQYVLFSGAGRDQGLLFEHATVDESVSDFVAGKVEDQLRSGRGSHVFQWFDPARPNIPETSQLAPGQQDLIMRMLRTLALPNGRELTADQIQATVEGLSTRVQLLQGPPGTGKTTTTAIATLTRILARRQIGEIVLVTAHTHTAVNTLLQRIDDLIDRYRTHSLACGLVLPAVQLSKVHTSAIDNQTGGRVIDFLAKPCATIVNSNRSRSVLVVGGTTGAILKMARELSNRRPFVSNPQGFTVPQLVVDEASMMVFPHFLSLATLLIPDGEILLAGDHRQLAPIVAHDWEREDRPPAVLYQPYASAFMAVQNISNNPRVSDHAVYRSALRFSFRLPAVIRELIGRLYRLDEIELEGLPRVPETECTTMEGSWARLWEGETGLFLVLHSERLSRQSNVIECRIIRDILAAGGDLPDRSVAVMTPHRAQRTLLQATLAAHTAAADVIDTVERLQGGERPTVIVSATASDPSAISANVEFVLNLNRSNVAFSRAQNRLIVVCSDTLLDHIPAEVEHYESAMLWKSLRAICSRQIGNIFVDECAVRIFTPPLEPITPQHDG